MTQSTMNKAKTRMLALCGILLLTLALMSGSAYATNDRVVTARSDYEGSATLVLVVENCIVNVEPSDDAALDVKFDSGALRMEQENDNGIMRLRVYSLSGMRMGYDAAATVYVPKAAFERFALECHNGDAMLMSGIQSNIEVSGYDDARVSLQYPAGNTASYSVRLLKSTCDFVMDGNAVDYAIDVKVTGPRGQLRVPAGAMPDYTGGSAYKYTNGTGAAVITGEILSDSSLNFGLALKNN